MKYFIRILLLSLIFSFSLYSQSLPVRFDYSEDQQDAINIFIGDSLFTTYLSGSNMEKPVFFPIYAPQRKIITRGFPLQPRPGERVDHPHHIGMWFNYGSVNGLDFWNNSSAIPANEKSKYGVVFQEEQWFKDGKHEGTLDVINSWRDQESKNLLTETTRFIFSGSASVWTIERFTTLEVSEGIDSVLIRDNKEGLLAIRMDRAFEEPVTQPEVFIDANGKPTAVPVLNNEGVNGVYRNSAGKKAGAVWGQRANWVALTAIKEGSNITVAMLDHPNNFGYPAHWHARGYGLFSVNNFGSKVYVPSDPDQELLLRPGKKITLRHRILIGESKVITDDYLNRQFNSFKKSEIKK